MFGTHDDVRRERARLGITRGCSAQRHVARHDMIIPTGEPIGRFRAAAKPPVVDHSWSEWSTREKTRT